VQLRCQAIDRDRTAAVGLAQPAGTVRVPVSGRGMDCRSCGHSNREGARFCAECGTPLGEPMVCASCGAANPPSARFCDACGQPLSTAPLPATPQHLAAKIRAGRAELAGERKQVTVLFADAVGSMELAERIGAEAWRRLMADYVSILADGIHRYEGTVDKFTGPRRVIQSLGALRRTN
jgi:hypothetical protein